MPQDRALQSHFLVGTDVADTSIPLDLLKPRSAFWPGKEDSPSKYLDADEVSDSDSDSELPWVCTESPQ